MLKYPYSTLRVGDRVILNVPENQRLHGNGAIIESFTDWGVMVICPAAATGKFRALYEEILPHPLVANGRIDSDGTMDVQEQEAPNTVNDSNVNMTVNKYRGFTGSICFICGGCNMVRNGTCELCQDCGSTTGCS